MRRWLIERGPDLGLFGVGLVGAASVVTALLYSGQDGEHYSPLNQAVSDLGEVAVSELAWLFNIGSITGGALIALYMLGIVLRSASAAGRAFGILGVLTGLAVMSIGLFPMDDIDGHLVATLCTFGGITLAAGWFAGWVFGGSAPYPRWLGALAAWVVVAMIVFVVMPSLLQPEWTFAMQFEADQPPRPDIWLAALLEWLVIGSALGWLALVAWHDRGDT